MIDFNWCVEHTLAHEGGYTFDPRDPGGETQWGISKHQYPDLDIKALTRDQAIEIYRRDFWMPVAAMVSGPIAFQVFDAAVNHGIGTAVRMLQEAVGAAPDGHWGPVSAERYHDADPCEVVLRFLAIRLRFFTRLSTFGTFGAGWAARVSENLLLAAEVTP
jgi:lysozyme family protein